MLKTKKDVDRHVSDIIRKLQNENERNLRGFNIARLYFQVKDYEMSQRYVTGFLSVRENHPEAHKLLAQIAEASGNLEKAVHSYKRSLELDNSQKDVVLQICRLYCQLPVDPETARYWADRGEKACPRHEAVFQLRECLVSADGETNLGELEQLITKELESRPLDVGLHIKLLKLYMDTERVQEAYIYAVEVEEKRPFPFSVNWYFCLTDICEAYQEECEQQITVEFYIHYLAVLDHLVTLVLAEPHALVSQEENTNRRSRNIVDSASILHTFDQQLRRCSLSDFPKVEAWGFILNHMKGQLYLHLATLLMKRAKKDQGNWKEACRHAAALLLVAYSFKPGNPQQEQWFFSTDSKRGTLLYFQKAGSARLSCAGHTVSSLCREDKTKWLQKIKQETCLAQVRDKIYQRAFLAVGQKQAASKSYFLQDATFLECSLEFPSHGSLLESDKIFYKLYPDCLHHLVWLSLHRSSDKLVQTCHNFQLFEGLQYSTSVLNTGAAESLCQLDVEAFLCATTYTASQALDQRKALIHRSSGDNVLCVPPDIADPLCTEQQGSWWKSAYALYTNTAGIKLSELRQILRRGLEVIRGVGNHGMDINLIVYLARAFNDQADSLRKTRGKDSSSVAALEERSAHYWSVALSILDCLMSNRRLQVPKERLFASYNREPSTREVTSLREEGRFHLATRDMNEGRTEEAAKAFEMLNSAYASYYLAASLKKLAKEKSQGGDEYVALVTKARDALYLTMDRISGDKKHPLNSKLQEEVEDLEMKLTESKPDAFDSCDETEEEDFSLKGVINGVTPERSREGSMGLQTSTPMNTSLAYRHLRPSPERLDAQIRALAYTQENLVRILTDQQQALIEKNKEIVEELKQNKVSLEDMKKQLEDLKTTSCHVCVRHKEATFRRGSKDREEMEVEDQLEGHTRVKEIPKIRSQQPRRPRPVVYPPEDSEEPEYPEEATGYPAEASPVYSSRRPHRGVMKGQEYDDGYEGNDYGDPYYEYALDSEGAAYGYLNGYAHGGLMPPGIGYMHQQPMMLQYPHHYPPTPHMPHLAPSQLRPRGNYHHMDRGLPFSDGQQLPQFNFRMAPPQHPPPVLPTPEPDPSTRPSIFSRLGSAEQPQQSFAETPSSPPRVPTSPWAPDKIDPVAVASAAHAFQIAMPSSGAKVSPIAPPGILSFPSPAVVPLTFGTPVGSDSQLKALLNNPSPTTTIGVGTSGIGSQLSAALSGRGALPKESTPKQQLDSSRDDTHSDPEEEAQLDFKPLIPLPAQVTICTGEESEKVLFEDRARLFRFVDKEWRERGIGTMKILENDAGKVRVLMRRDQVFKICANHYISGKMELLSMKDKAFIWGAQDFADEEVKDEKFYIRFKTMETAMTFKREFEKAIENAKAAESKTIQKPSPACAAEVPSGFGDAFKPKAGNWICSVCLVNNNENSLACVACETPKPGLSAGPSKVNAVAVSSPSIFSGSGLQSSVKDSNIVPSTLSPFVTITPTTSSGFAPASSLLTQLASPLTSGATVVFGGFSFSSVPLIQESKKEEIKEVKPQETPKSEPKTSPFINLNFQSGPTNSSVLPSMPVFGSISDIKDLSFGSLPPTPAQGFQKDSNFKGFPKAGSVLFSGVADIPSQSRDIAPDDFEPTTEFNPSIPLPELIETKTGEEDEAKLFGDRAKLFRFDPDTKEWKERGIGEMKIMRHNRTGRCRLLMRREQVHKLCANHYILPDIKLCPMSTSDKAWTWTAQDFSEGELKSEQLAARFKNSDIARDFKIVFTKCQEEGNQNGNLTPTSPSASISPDSKPLSEVFKLTADSWECSACYIRNPTNKTMCAACTSPKPGLVVDAKTPLSEMFKPAMDSWECSSCYIRNPNDKSICVACTSPKPGSAVDAKTPSSEMFKPTTSVNAKMPLSEMFKPAMDSWECSSCYIRNPNGKSICAACTSPKPGTPVNAAKTEDKPLSELFKPEAGTWECSTCCVRNQRERNSCVSCETQRPETASVTEPQSTSTIFGTKFGVSESLKRDADSTSKSSALAEFKFGMPSSTSTTANAAKFSFGTPQPSESSATNLLSFGCLNKPAASSSENTSFSFGNTSAATSPNPFGFNFGTPVNSTKNLDFRFGSPQKYEFSFSGVRPRSPNKTPKSPGTPSDVSRDLTDEEPEPSDADNIFFQPVIPLPPKVDVKTGEEGEAILYCQRAKLYRFDQGEWKERGVGDIKILHNLESGAVRLLMRREQVLKVCVNHNLTSELELVLKGDKTWMWSATDFSENEPHPEQLALRFKKPEIAQQFKKAIEDGQHLLKSPGQNSLDTKPSIEPTAETPTTSSASTFSFRLDAKPSTSEGAFSLSSRFGTAPNPGRSLFGNASPAKQDSTDDVNVVYEKKPTDEQIQKAARLLLPRTFFLYEDKPPCPGCRGCRDEIPPCSDWQDETSIASGSATATTSQQNGTVVKIEENISDVECVHQNIPTPEQAEQAAKLQLAPTFYLYKDKQPCPGCRGCSEHSAPQLAEEGNEKESAEPQEAAATEKETESPDVYERPLFGSQTLLSFAQLASQMTSTPQPSFQTSSKAIFAGAGKPLFAAGSSTQNEDGEENDDQVAASLDVHFEPVLPLPELVDVKTGEEEETPLFSQRVRLYRYENATHQWKERGVGDMKILKHSEKCQFRLILRREQVHKVACNHYISADMELKPVNNSELTLCWSAVDYSEGSLITELFALRFKNKDHAEEFKSRVEECKQQLLEEMSREPAKESEPLVEEPEESQDENETEDDENHEEDEENHEEDDEEEIMYEKQVELAIATTNVGEYKPAGTGILKVLYDDTVYGARLQIIGDDRELLVDHMIAIQTCLRTSQNQAFWAALDMSVEPPTRRHFRATFALHADLQDFQFIFDEGKEYAVSSEIVEEQDHLPTH